MRSNDPLFLLILYYTSKDLRNFLTFLVHFMHKDCIAIAISEYFPTFFFTSGTKVLFVLKFGMFAICSSLHAQRPCLQMYI